MQTTLRIHRGVQALYVAERLDEETAGAFGREVDGWADRLLSANQLALWLDLGAVTLVSSSVVRTLLATARRAKRRGGRLVLANLTENVYETFAASGLRELFNDLATFERDSTQPVANPEPTETTKLEVLIDGRAYPCENGDILGTDGSIAVSLLHGIPGLAVEHVTFLFDQHHWYLKVADEASIKTRLDEISLAPGQTVKLKDEHLIRLAALQVGLRVTAASPLNVGQAKVREAGEIVADAVANTTQTLRSLFQN